jgi:hypothetical protein
MRQALASQLLLLTGRSVTGRVLSRWSGHESADETQQNVLGGTLVRSH